MTLPLPALTLPLLRFQLGVLPFSFFRLAFRLLIDSVRTYVYLHCLVCHHEKRSLFAHFKGRHTFARMRSLRIRPSFKQIGSFDIGADNLRFWCQSVARRLSSLGDRLPSFAALPFFLVEYLCLQLDGVLNSDRFLALGQLGRFLGLLLRVARVEGSEGVHGTTVLGGLNLEGHLGLLLYLADALCEQLNLLLHLSPLLALDYPLQQNHLDLADELFLQTAA